MATTTKAKKERLPNRYRKAERIVILVKAVQSACEKQLALIDELETIGVSELIGKACASSLAKTKRIVSQIAERMEKPLSVAENEMDELAETISVAK